MKGTVLSTVLMLLALMQAACASNTEYDLVIHNGRVVDPETMYDAVANVGIEDGRIAVITKDKNTGRETIDATGHVVAPGFVDIHAHGQNIGDYRMQAMQGVTTMLELPERKHRRCKARSPRGKAATMSCDCTQLSGIVLSQAANCPPMANRSSMETLEM
jgi:dihydroorotase-like cyclic amidohydrolase